MCIKNFTTLEIPQIATKNVLRCDLRDLCPQGTTPQSQWLNDDQTFASYATSTLTATNLVHNFSISICNYIILHLNFMYQPHCIIKKRKKKYNNNTKVVPEFEIIRNTTTGGRISALDWEV